MGHSLEIEKFNGNYDKINHFLLSMFNQGKTIIVCLNDKHMISDYF